jgi:hypothetical protein
MFQLWKDCIQGSKNDNSNKSCSQCTQPDLCPSRLDWGGGIIQPIPALHLVSSVVAARRRVPKHLKWFKAVMIVRKRGHGWLTASSQSRTQPTLREDHFLPGSSRRESADVHFPIASREMARLTRLSFPPRRSLAEMFLASGLTACTGAASGRQSPRRLCMRHAGIVTMRCSSLMACCIGYALKGTMAHLSPCSVVQRSVGPRNVENIVKNCRS